MTKLNQMLAIRTDADRVAQDAYQKARQSFQSADNFRGLDRTYRPKDEDGDIYPSENKPVQYTVDNVIAEMKAALVRQLDVLGTIDYANTQALADVEVEGVTLLEQVPATFLLTLESKLGEWEKLIDTIPVLDPGKPWQPQPDPITGHWIARPIETVRSRKVPKEHVLYPATDRHPAQVQAYTVDEKEGLWLLVERSGAIDAPGKRQLLERVHRLRDAVVMARQEANSRQIEAKKLGETIFDYIFD